VPIPKSASEILRTGVPPGILGGLLAFAASNLWFYYFAARLLPGIANRTLMPDFCSFLQIDVYVGAGCGYAGAITARNIAGLGGAEQQPRLIPVLYPVILGTGISLIVNTLLFVMSMI